MKHFIIAAKLGYDESMKELWKHYSRGNITKDDLDATLRTHQAALDEMKSTQRDAAEASGAFSTEERMRELEGMKSLLTEEEYQRKRAEILSDV